MFQLFFIVYHISWKEAMERAHSENGADLDDPALEVNPKVKQESDNITDDVSQQKHTLVQNKIKLGRGVLLQPIHSCFECDKALNTIKGQKKHVRIDSPYTKKF